MTTQRKVGLRLSVVSTASEPLSVDVPIGPNTDRIVRALAAELSPELFAHAVRRALVNAALGYADRLDLTRADELAALDEITAALKGA